MELTAEFSVPFTHRLIFTQDAFRPDNAILAGLLPRASRTLIFVDQGLLEAQPELPARLQAYGKTHDLHLPTAIPVPGGEVCKNDPAVFDRICRAIAEAGLDRHSFVLVLGGGAVLDVVGFAAAVVHRGVRLIRLPSTTLAQTDSGVGVKNGINAYGKKNMLGAFAPPWAVINDENLLTTLTDEDWRSGFAEAVKVAVVKDPALFDRLASQAPAIRARDLAAALPVLERSAALHFAHIVKGTDPFEMTTARPLDFGHWAAHKLEQMTGFELRHGPAVSVGVALDARYAALAGLLPPAAAESICRTLAALGLPTHHPIMRDVDLLLAGLEDFRQHLGGVLTITLPTAIGHPVDVHEIDRTRMRAAIHQLAVAV